ncbi:MAG TPA: hypothetical protein VHY84_15470 [Bryobacteraceae bacterium]|jgi:hypothetical protein|nr:hypothetical protein [Bryobacteraceae bacterium]
MQSLQHARLKAARALEHLEAYRCELEKYYDSKPYAVTRTNDADRGQHVIRIFLKDPGDKMAILAGEFAHALRSSLDHTVYSLIIFATNAIPDSRAVQWPVQERQDDKQFERQTRGMHTDAANIIKSLQPYHEGPGEAFRNSQIWQLHMLDIIDKHRRIAFHENALDCHFPGLKESDGISFEPDVDGWGEVTLPLHLSKTEMLLNPKPRITFGDVPERLTLDVEMLSELYTLVTAKILPQFDGFFV